MFMFNQEMHDSSLIYEYIRKVKTSRHLSVIHSVDALWICFVSSILHCPAHIFSHFLTFYLSFSVCCSHSFANIAKPKSSYHRFAGITFCMWVCRFFSAISNSNKNSNSFSETRKREPMKNDKNIEEENVCVARVANHWNMYIYYRCFLYSHYAWTEQ